MAAIRYSLLQTAHHHPTTGRGRVAPGARKEPALNGLAVGPSEGRGRRGRRGTRGRGTRGGASLPPRRWSSHRVNALALFFRASRTTIIPRQAFHNNLYLFILTPPRAARLKGKWKREERGGAPGRCARFLKRDPPLPRRRGPRTARARHSHKKQNNKNINKINKLQQRREKNNRQRTPFRPRLPQVLAEVPRTGSHLRNRTRSRGPRSCRP